MPNDYLGLPHPRRWHGTLCLSSSWPAGKLPWGNLIKRQYEKQRHMDASIYRRYPSNEYSEAVLDPGGKIKIIIDGMDIPIPWHIP